MKALVITTILFFFLVPTSIIRAYQLKEIPKDVVSGQEIILEITAEPNVGENLVSINLLSSGIEITNYNFLVTDDWIVKTDDCPNGRSFTETSICTTLVKGSDIITGESLGLVTIKITDPENYSIFKVEDGGYSNGEVFREVTGEFLAIDESTDGFDTSEIDPLILFFGIGLLISAIVLLGGLAIYLTKKR